MELTKTARFWLPQSKFWHNLMKARGHFSSHENKFLQEFEPNLADFTRIYTFDIVFVVDLTVYKCFVGYRTQEVYNHSIHIIIYVMLIHIPWQMTWPIQPVNKDQ